MDFRPTLFTFIVYLLYYTLCLLYKRHSRIFYYLKNTIQSFSISNMISELLLWPFFLTVLSLLVLLHSQHRFHHHNSRCSLLPLNLRRLPVVVFGFGPTTAIVEESYTAQTIACVIIAVNITSITFLQVSLRSSCTNLHVGGSLAVIEDRTCCPKLLRQIPCTPHVVLSSSWCHPWRH